MTKKRDKEVFLTNFRDVVRDGLLSHGYKLATDKEIAELVERDSRYTKKILPKYGYPERIDGDAGSVYFKIYPDDLFGVILWSLQPKADFKKGIYVSNLFQGIAHGPTNFLLSELEKVPFRPFLALQTEGVRLASSNDLYGYDSKLPAETLRIKANAFLSEVEANVIPWIEKNASLTELKLYADNFPLPYLGKVCFYITIGEIQRARAEMNRLVQNVANRYRKYPKAKRKDAMLAMEESRRLRHLWIDDEIIEQVNQLTLEPQ